MRLITIILVVLLILIQYPLWMGKGGFFRVRELTLHLDAAKEKNEIARQRNARLASEVKDLKEGTEAIEEHARYELGMIKKDEIFIQVIDTSKIPDKNKPIVGNIIDPQPEQHNKTEQNNATTTEPGNTATTGTITRNEPTNLP